MPSPTIIHQRLVDKAALAFLKNKKLAQGFSHYDIWLYEHATQFTVAKMMDFDLLAETHQALFDARNNGTGFNDFKKHLKPYLMSKGWWGEQVMVDPLDGKKKLVQLGSTRRLETIYTTNMRSASAHGQWQRIQKIKKGLPYLKYIGSTAKNKREAHRRYAGLILPVDDPFWASHFPPNGYGCQCSVQQLTRQQAQREGGVSQSPDIKIVDVVNQRTGEIKQVAEGVTPSFAYNPGDRLGALNHLFQEKLDSYSDLDGNPIFEIRDIRKLTSDYILNKVERPAFENRSPLLMLKFSDGLAPFDNPQAKAFLYAGTGKSYNQLPVGTVGSIEKIKTNTLPLLIEYEKDGVNVYASSIGLSNSQLSNVIEQSFLYKPAMNYLDKHPEILKKGQKLGLETAELLSITGYTHAHGYIQKALIAPERIKEIYMADLSKVMADNMKKGIAKLPDYQGTVIRRVTADMLDKFNVGDIYTEKGFFSSSISTIEDPTQDAFRFRSVRLIIQAKHGKVIKELSSNPQQNEVVFMPGSRFKVIAKEQKGNVTWISISQI